MATFYVRIPPDMLNQCDDESLEQAVSRTICAYGLVLSESPDALQGSTTGRTADGWTDIPRYDLIAHARTEPAAADALAYALKMESKRATTFAERSPDGAYRIRSSIDFPGGERIFKPS